MSEKAWRNTFIIGTAACLLILIGFTIHSLNQVVSARTPPVTDQVAAGKWAWQQSNCNDCHTILGIGGYFAPDLTKVINTRGTAWLVSWLKNPQAVLPQTSMPNQNLSDTQVQDLAAFFAWVGKVDTNNWPPQPITNLAGSTSANGELLFQQKGCIGCHMVNGTGAQGPGPDLSHIATQPYDGLDNSPEFLSKWLEDPVAQKPDTTMPRLTLTPGERDALVQYLSSLK